MALAALGLCTAFALLIACRRLCPILLEVTLACGIYVSVIFASGGKSDQLNQRIHVLASYVFVTWFYCAVVRIIPALRAPLSDQALLKVDKFIFGQTPAVYCEPFTTGRLTDLLSLCYLTYFFYLFAAVIHAALYPNAASARLSEYLFTSFAVGFAGYLLVPAIGPVYAFPQLFDVPLGGNVLTRFIGTITKEGSSRFDVFPSLHVLITCILLDHDWREFRRRFWLMLLPSIGLLISTIYLRYHYGIDVLAALILFLALRRTFLNIQNSRIKLPWEAFSRNAS